MKQSPVWVVISIIAMCVSGWASQQTTQSPPSAAPLAAAPAPQGDAQVALKERATAYYTALIGGNRMAAEQMIVPDTRPDFEQTDFKALAAFKIDQLTLDSSGEKADVTVTRTFASPFAMSMPWHDQWVKIDGEWMLAFPKNNHETPFGVMKPSTTPVDPQVMQRMAERQMHSVDPDQPMMQLQKYLKDHPDAVPSQTIMVPMPKAPNSMQQQNSSSQPQSDGKASSAAKAAASDANAGKNKKKNSKKSKQPANTAAAPQS